MNPAVPEFYTKDNVCFLTTDSRSVQPGSVFFAIQGTRVDGHDFIEEALQQGAKRIVADKNHAVAERYSATEKVVLVENVPRFLGEAAAVFFNRPCTNLALIGVTGTNGKTTTTYLLESILQADGRFPALIGTVENRFGAFKIHSSHTTPNAIDLQKMLADFLQAGAKSAVMEVSSHALDQHRVSGCLFRAGVFTNLTQDHLDYHRDMDSYFLAKLRLFTDYALKARAIHSNDAYGRKIAETLTTRKLEFQTYGTTANDAISYSSLLTDARGISGSLTGSFGNIAIESALVGDFNRQNIAAAALCALQIGVKKSSIEEGIRNVTVPGRMERVANNLGIHVFVDYAHTPDALEKALATLKKIKEKGASLKIVFGCGGDRDSSKRPLMGTAATTFSDETWVTSDNPRSENPSAIVADILKGTQRPVHTEIDRRTAIKEAIRSMRENDILLIAGKGHETYQIIGSEKLPFDDREVAREYLTSRKQH